MIYQHIQTDADLTVAVRRVNPYETERFGIVSVGSENRIVEFREKPKHTRETLASMGIYIFRRDVLLQVLLDSEHVDFGKDVLPAMLGNSLDVFAYPFPGYWADVGTVQAYWEANMSLLSESPALDLYDPQWVVHTRSEERAPCKIGPSAQVSGNLLSNGCRVDGIVERSVLSPGVYVAEGAIVRDSVLLNDTVVASGAVVDRCIIDKGVRIQAGARVGEGEDNTPNVDNPEFINTGITLVGKECIIPENIVIGRNVVVHANTEPEAFGKRKQIASGSSIGTDMR
jgi:glucose-1-phosphate adenylyltransferase